MTNSISMTDQTPWITSLLETETQSPWNPGPLTQADSDWLAARDQEIGTAETVLLNNDILVLTGVTGVGKSSFINAGLLPKLEATGWYPFCFNEPSYETLENIDGEGEMADFDAMLRRSYLDVLGLKVDVFAEKNVPADKTTEVALILVPSQGAAVTPLIVLDQFETFLMNASPKGIRAFNKWLPRILALNVKIIISLRSENKHLLPRFTGKAGYVELQPLLSQEAIREITGRKSHGSDTCPLPSAVQEDVCTIFQSYRSGVTTVGHERPPERPPSLIELNSVLYLEYWYHAGAINERGERELSTNDAVTIAVERAIHALEAAAGKNDDTADKISDLMSKVFFAMIQLKLDHCAAALQKTDDVRADIWVPLIRDQIKRVTPLLATGDYKTRWELSEYFTAANARTITMFQAQYQNEIPVELRTKACQGITTYDRLYFPELKKLFPVEESGEPVKNLSGSLLQITRDELDEQLLAGQTSEATETPHGIDCVPWESDPAEVTSALSLGLPPRDAIFELERCFLIAATWLSVSRLCRVNPAIGTMALIHDGMAKALNEWSDNLPDLPDAAVASPFAVIGERIVWGGTRRLEGTQDARLRTDWPETAMPLWDDNSGLPYHDANPLVDSQMRLTNGKIRLRAFKVSETAPFPGKGEIQLLTNARWPRNEIVEIDFRRTAFVNCDFSNTRFTQCHFEGTTFVNCILDGVIFDRCTIHGKATGDPVENLDDWINKDQQVKWPLKGGSERDAPYGAAYGTPAFAIRSDNAAKLLTAFGRGSSEQWVFSRSVGVPATTLEEEHWNARQDKHGHRYWPMTDEKDRPLPVGIASLAQEGLTILGGRISSLMFTRPIRDDSGLAHPDTGDQESTAASIRIIYAAGANLDFAETGRLDLAITGSAIRGLTITRPINALESSSESDAFRVSIVGSMVMQLWIGSMIQGSLTADDSTVAVLTNLSQKTFGVSIPTVDNPLSRLTDIWAMPNGLSDPDISSRILQQGSDESEAEETAFEIKANFRSDPAKADLSAAEED